MIKENDEELKELLGVEDEEEVEEEELKVDNKKETNASTIFENCIKDYLDEFAKNDSNFKLKYSMKNKSITSCCNYIVSEVKKMNVQGLADDEVFKIARHYYEEEIDENEIKNVNCKVVINKDVKKERVVKETKKKGENEANQFSGGLFDLL